MANINVQAPIIPVLDELLICPVDGEKEHRSKIESYNELLESIYYRELELSKLKAGLLDMRQEILEEAQTLDPRGTVLVARPVTEVSFVEEATGSESDASDGSSASDGVAHKKRRGGKKAKGKGRGRSFGEEMSDYNVNPSRRQVVRRMSDAEADD